MARIGDNSALLLGDIMFALGTVAAGSGHLSTRADIPGIVGPRVGFGRGFKTVEAPLTAAGGGTFRRGCPAHRRHQRSRHAGHADRSSPVVAADVPRPRGLDPPWMVGCGGHLRHAWWLVALALLGRYGVNFAALHRVGADDHIGDLAGGNASRNRRLVGLPLVRQARLAVGVDLHQRASRNHGQLSSRSGLASPG